MNDCDWVRFMDDDDWLNFTHEISTGKTHFRSLFLAPEYFQQLPLRDERRPALKSNWFGVPWMLAL